MEDCIFCKIIAGEIPAAKIYEDDKVLAFIDIKPVNDSHALIIPKEHYRWMVDTPDDLVAHIYVVAKKLMVAIKTATNADYISIVVVGNEVPHFHIHLIPRYHTDSFVNWPTHDYKAGEMETAAEKIRKELN
jgi:histidine triad (HIT) family protein